MYGRFWRDQRGFIFIGGIAAVIFLVVYILLIPWYLHYHAPHVHGHGAHNGGVVDGFFQGFYIVVGIIWHFFINGHVKIWAGPTITLWYLVAFLLGFVVFLYAFARVRD